MYKKNFIVALGIEEKEERKVTKQNQEEILRCYFQNKILYISQREGLHYLKTYFLPSWRIKDERSIFKKKGLHQKLYIHFCRKYDLWVGYDGVTRMKLKMFI